MMNEDANSSGQPPETALLNDKLTPLLSDLFYPSESDEPVEFVTCYLKQAEPLSVTQINHWLMLPPDVSVEERPEADFWAPVTTDEDWYDEEEKKRTARFRQLQAVLEQHLTGRQVFRVGQVDIDLYLLGRQTNGERAGLKTKVVET